MIQEASEQYRRVLIYGAYLAGHLDGLDRTFEEGAPKAFQTIEQHTYFRPFVAPFIDALRLMHSSYGEWKSADVYEPLKEIANQLLKAGGIEIHDNDDGSGNVKIPLRPETTPTLAETLEFWASRNENTQKQQ